MSVFSLLSHKLVLHASTLLYFFLLPDCEIPANVVFVMDESGSVGIDNHLKEKEFIGLVVIITPLM